MVRYFALSGGSERKRFVHPVSGKPQSQAAITRFIEREMSDMKLTTSKRTGVDWMIVPDQSTTPSKSKQALMTAKTRVVALPDLFERKLAPFYDDSAQEANEWLVALVYSPKTRRVYHKLDEHQLSRVMYGRALVDFGSSHVAGVVGEVGDFDLRDVIRVLEKTPWNFDDKRDRFIFKFQREGDIITVHSDKMAKRL